MIFNSLTFLVFFAVVLLLDAAIGSWRARKAMLLIASYLFYAAWNPVLILLIWASTIIDWFAAKNMGRSRSLRARRAWLLTSLCTNLGLLFTFKYAQFALDSLEMGLSALGVHYAAPALGLVLPVGISFYTFQTLSYTIDVYRGDQEPWESALDFFLYVSFFPQLVAGPIVRASEFREQLRVPRRSTSAQRGWGAVLILFGLVQKVVLADALLAPVVDEVFQRADAVGTLEAWLGTLAFSGQIFFDFAGYSLCAIGTALCLGFHLPDNFRAPYAAEGFSDFWRRWHISLSSWLRDYLYIPLGGNRRGGTRTYANLAATMLLGGLWHGASWMFVVWGALHGTYLVVERRVRAGLAPRSTPPGRAARWLGRAGTYAAVCLAWVFFRAPDMTTATNVVRAMFAGEPGVRLLEGDRRVVAAGIVFLMFLMHGWVRDTPLDALWQRTPAWLRVAVLTSLLFLLCITGGEDRAFIYFQF